MLETQNINSVISIHIFIIFHMRELKRNNVLLCCFYEGFCALCEEFWEDFLVLQSNTDFKHSFIHVLHLLRWILMVFD